MKLLSRVVFSQDPIISSNGNKLVVLHGGAARDVSFPERLITFLRTSYKVGDGEQFAATSHDML